MNSAQSKGKDQRFPLPYQLIKLVNMNLFTFQVSLCVSLPYLLLQLDLCSSSPLLPFRKFPSQQLIISSNQAGNDESPNWKFPKQLQFLQKLGREKEEDDEDNQQSINRNLQSKTLLSFGGSLVRGVRVPPILRNLTILCQSPSLVSLGFGISVGLGCLMLNVSHAEAKTGISPMLDDDHRPSQLPPHVVIGRALKFWKKVGPIIAHYKFATFWMNRVKAYDRRHRDEIYEALHQKYAPQAKDVAYEMKGMCSRILVNIPLQKKLLCARQISC